MRSMSSSYLNSQSRVLKTQHSNAHRVDNAKASKRSSHFGLTQGVRLVLVKVSEGGLELLKLSRREVGHIS